MKKGKLIHSIIKHISKITIVDWFLIIFMIILLTQTTYNLFVNELNGNSHGIDGVIRTTTAGLFGYFMGNGFSRIEDKKHNILSLPSTKIIPEKSVKPDLKNLPPVISELGEIDPTRSNIQIIIVGAIGVVSLILLIITRNTNILTIEKIATLSQLRDFVSASTGFLISNSKNR